MSPALRNTALFTLAILLAGLAVITLLPYGAAKTNDLGYGSLCPFAPWSTLALAAAGGLVVAVRHYLMTRGS